MSADFGTPTFKPLTQQDLPLLHAWLQRPHVAQWWREPTSLVELERDYLPRTLAAPSTRAYIAMLNGEPIGFIQSYVAMGSAMAGGSRKPIPELAESISSWPTRNNSVAVWAVR